ncbi:hypothetical protein BDV25DRAFT_135160 [Aspergillus avenaceus]|uniref:Integral membrane protein n=1 Tax=Aspergillus avenaceus TaxID=36643 RepID=A0A5N6U920_ASPAV|nr:hypothetical protein BDV25DRAFT_135160 [Aspergillus avenaceus]
MNLQHISSPRMTRETARDRFLLPCGPLALLCIFIFLAASRLLPPVSPSKSPEDLVAHYSQNKSAIDAGVFLCLVGSILWPLYTVAINNQLSRIPGIHPTILSLQTASGAVSGATILLIGIFFAAATYRLDRDPVVTELASDLAWLAYTFASTPWFVQEAVLSWGICCDYRAKPLIPHWVAWVNAGLSLSWIPTYATHIVHDGPLAWNGGYTFWVPWGTSGIMYTLVTIYFWKAAGIVDGGEVVN